MGRTLLLWRLAQRDLRRHPVESLMVFLVLAAATTTFTVAFALSRVTDHPYQQTRQATAGPDVIANVFSGLPNPGDGNPTSSRGSQATDTRPSAAAAVASLVTGPGVVAHSGPYPYVYTSVGFDGRRVDVVAEGRDREPETVEQPKQVQGTWVQRGGVVLESGFADALGARIGDQVDLGGQTLRIVGFAVTAGVPAYPSSLCHLACLMAVPQNMGLVWVTRPAATELAGNSATTTYLVNLKLSHPGQASAFVAAHQGSSVGGSVAVLYTWQSIRGADEALIQIEQVALKFGGFLLGLLALAGLVVLVGRRMTEQLRRIGLLKAVGATPATVAVVLLVEHLALGVGAATVGLFAGWLVAPLLTSSGAGLLGAPGTPAIGASTVAVAAGVGLGVAAVSSLVPAIRAARTSSVADLADTPRTSSRRPLTIALSARLPVPLLLAVRQLGRRPRRALLNAASVAVTVTGIVAVLTYAHTHASGKGQISNLKIERLDELMAMVTVMLIILAAVNTTFIAWATAADSRFSSALERALGATAGQVAAGMSIAALLPGLPAAFAGVPLGLLTFQVLDPGQALTQPPVWRLVAVVFTTLLAVTSLTGVPSLRASRRPPAQTLQLQ